MDIKLENSKIVKIIENCFCYFQYTIDNFDIDLLSLIIDNNENTKNCEILFGYSYDKINYSEFVSKENFTIPDLTLPIYFAINFKPREYNDLKSPLTLYQTKNVDSEDRVIELKSIIYDNNEINLFDETIVIFLTIYNVLNEFPKWNLYDGQIVTINSWLAQCNAIAEMYGHTCIYFKTEAIEKEIKHTFANKILRNVVSIKKLHILFPNNEIPQDRNVYTDWDIPLQDDIVIHVVKEKFIQAFGETTPNVKDYLYLPLVNKLFRVNAMQPKTGFMGKTAWWEVYLAKFEDDETITISDELKTSMSHISDFDQAMNELELESEVLDEIETIKEDAVLTSEKISLKTIEEKKSVNQNYTNKLVDSNNYISVKETEKQREFINNRLSIVSVNPDNESFPVTMYNNTTVEKRVVGLQYCLKDYTTKNKFSTIINKSFELSLNYILLANYTGELIDIIDSSGVLSFFTLKNNRNKLEIIDNRNNQSFQIDYNFELSEFYNILLNFDLSLNQFSIKIFKLQNKEKSLEYNNIYLNQIISISTLNIGYIHLYGGNFYSGEIILNIDSNNILKDFVNPILIMKHI